MLLLPRMFLKKPKLPATQHPKRLQVQSFHLKMHLMDMILHQELFLSAMERTRENVKSIHFLRLMELTSLKLFKKLLRLEFTKKKRVRKKKKKRKRRNQNLHLKLHHPKRWLLTRKKDGVHAQLKTGLKKSQLRSQFAMETN
jgi:hypothetical protein